jgi:hypothetical protein
MESPFANTSCINMYIEPVLHSYYKTYINIITFSDIPQGPIADMVSMSHFPKLSPFQTASPFYGGSPTYGRGAVSGSCVPVLLRYPKRGLGGNNVNINNIKNADVFMTAKDIPAVLSYLRTNGYIIETDITKIIQRTDIDIGDSNTDRMSGRRKFICMFSYT